MESEKILPVYYYQLVFHKSGWIIRNTSCPYVVAHIPSVLAAEALQARVFSSHPLVIYFSTIVVSPHSVTFQASPVEPF